MTSACSQRGYVRQTSDYSTMTGICRHYTVMVRPELGRCISL